MQELFSYLTIRYLKRNFGSVYLVRYNIKYACRNIDSVEKKLDIVGYSFQTKKASSEGKENIFVKRPEKIIEKGRVEKSVF